MGEDGFWGNIFRKKGEAEGGLSSVLSKIPVFEGLGKGEIRRLERLVHLRRYREGEVIFRERQPGVGMYIIKSGRVSIRQRMADGQERELSTLSAGDFFGELALLDEKPRSASAIAMEPSEMIGFFQPDLFDLIKRDPRLGVKIALRLARIIGVRLRQTNEQLKELQQSSEQEG